MLNVVRCKFSTVDFVVLSFFQTCEGDTCPESVCWSSQIDETTWKEARMTVTKKEFFIKTIVLKSILTNIFFV